MRMVSRVVEGPDGETSVTVTSEVNVTGILAQLGRGMIQDVSDEMFQKFTTVMRAELEGGAPGAESEESGTEVGKPAPGTSETPGTTEALDGGCPRCQGGQKGARTIGAATHFLGRSGSAGRHDLLDMATMRTDMATMTKRMATMTTCEIRG